MAPTYSLKLPRPNTWPKCTFPPPPSSTIYICFLLRLCMNLWNVTTTHMKPWKDTAVIWNLQKVCFFPLNFNKKKKRESLKWHYSNFFFFFMFVCTEESPPWSEDECRNFEHALQIYEKNFHLIQKHKACSTIHFVTLLKSLWFLLQFF